MNGLLPPAPLRLRALAFAYDVLPLLGLWFLAGVIGLALTGGALDPHRFAHRILVQALAAILCGGYFVVSWTRGGQTLGMRAWGLHAVDEQGRRLRVLRALLRFVWATLAWLPGALGVLFLYLDPEHLPLHDRLSRTRLLYVPRRG